MDKHGERGLRSHRPLLLNFARRQPDSDVGRRYNAEKNLNVTAADGIPVIAIARSMTMLKSQGEGPAED